MRFFTVDRVRLDPEVLHQLHVTAIEPAVALSVAAQLVRRRRRVVRPVFRRHTVQPDQRRLKTFAQGQETLTSAQGTPLPVGVRQHAVAEPLLEGLAVDRQPQTLQTREVRRQTHAGPVILREVDFLLWTGQRPPPPHMTLERSQLSFVVLPAMLLTQPLEQRLGFQLRRLSQHRLRFRPVGLKRIRPRPPVPRYHLLRRQLSTANVGGRRIAVHPRLHRRHLYLPALLVLHE